MTTRHAIVGIDIGKDELFVGFLPETPDAIAPKHWRSVVSLSYKDPRWWQTLLDLIDDEAIIAAEPTGHHLLAPVASLLYAYRPQAQLWQVDHRLAEHFRASHVAAAKNDRLDAIALTLIARAIAAGQPPRSCRPYNYFLESAVQRLRMLVNQQQRLVKENTRTQNRLHVLAHSLFPAFAGSPTWARAVRHGAVTPAQVKALAALEPPPGDYADGRTRRYLAALAADLPDIETDPAVEAAILDLIAHQRLIDEQLAVVMANIRSAIEAPTFAAVTRRWRTLHGANDLAIAALHVATLGRTLELDKDEFRAAVGINPRTSISGSGDRTRASRGGYQPVRPALHMWAFSMISPKAPENAVRAYYEAVEARPFAAAKNKLARVLWGVARNPKLDQIFATSEGEAAP